MCVRYQKALSIPEILEMMIYSSFNSCNDYRAAKHQVLIQAEMRKLSVSEMDWWPDPLTAGRRISTPSSLSRKTVKMMGGWVIGWMINEHSLWNSKRRNNRLNVMWGTHRTCATHSNSLVANGQLLLLIAKDPVLVAVRFWHSGTRGDNWKRKHPLRQYKRQALRIISFPEVSCLLANCVGKGKADRYRLNFPILYRVSFRSFQDKKKRQELHKF